MIVICVALKAYVWLINAQFGIVVAYECERLTVAI